MRVKILEVLPGRPRPQAVVATPVGVLRGAWFGSVPEVGADHHVEIEVGAVLAWGQEIREEPPRAEAVAMAGNEAEIHGHLESVQESGVVDVRVGGALVVVETEGTPPTVGAFVHLRVANLSLYDQQI